MKRYLAALLLALVLPAQADTWSFAVFGDTPYNRPERDRLPFLFEAMAEQGAAFAIHVGDIKSGNSRCDDALFQDRMNLFQSAPLPLIYVLGDNEWTDCHRAGGDPLERLARLRTLFHATPESLGRPRLPLERQTPDYPENQRWRRGPVLFLGLNVPGSRNNMGVGPEPSAEFLARDRANLAWMTEGFRQAKAAGQSVVVIAIQANPDFEAFNAGDPAPGYGDFLTRLRDETLNFGGEVVLLHGDTHRIRIDQPLSERPGGSPIARFTRIETYGSPWMGWVRVIVDEEARRLRFEPNPYVAAWPLEEDRRFKFQEPPLPPLPKLNP